MMKENLELLYIHFMELLNNPENLPVIILSILLFLSLLWILTLTRTLHNEKRKRIVPILNFEIDYEQLILYLKNSSYCSAHNVIVEDLPIALHYEFEKNITLKFEPIDVISANEKKQVTYYVFEGQHKLGPDVVENLVIHLTRATFEARIYYRNAEHLQFSSVIIKDSNKFIIKETKPLK